MLIAQSCRLFTTAWIVAHQALMSMGFSRQEYWSGLPFPSPGDLSNPGIKPVSPALQLNSLRAKLPEKPKHCIMYVCMYKNIIIGVTIKSLALPGRF